MNYSKAICWIIQHGSRSPFHHAVWILKRIVYALTVSASIKNFLIKTDLTGAYPMKSANRQFIKKPTTRILLLPPIFRYSHQLRHRAYPSWISTHCISGLVAWSLGIRFSLTRSFWANQRCDPEDVVHITQFAVWTSQTAQTVNWILVTGIW